MLKIIRESMQGLIAWAIIIMLIVPFALWGINQYFGNAGPLVAAKVNGKEISIRAYQQAYNQQRDQMRKILGAQYNPSIYDDRIKKQAIDGLVEREILFQNANDMGLRVSSESVVSTIQGIQAFKQDGKFSDQAYTQVLQSQGETPATFENRVQHSILTQQIYEAVNNSAIATKKEVDNILRLQQQTRDFSYLTIPVAKYKNAVVKDEEIKKYYDDHKDEFMSPEKVSLEYVELKAANLDKDKMPTEAELKQLYQDKKGQFSSPEERRSRQILISVPERADAKTIAAARKKAEDLRKRIIAGESFEKLAKKYSDDPGSSKLGGDIGFFGRNGGLEPAYEKALFSLKKGEVSQPVLSSFGFHIIKLEDIQAGKVKPFEQVKDQLIKGYQQGIAEKDFYKKSEKLTNLAYEVPDTLNDAANAVGLKVQTTDLFDRQGGKGIASNRKVIVAAFSDDVLKQGYNSEPIEIGDEDVVVIRLKDHVAKKQQALDEVKDKIKARLVSEQARKKAHEAGEKLIAELQKGSAPSEAAKSLGEQWKDAKSVKRDDHTVNAAILKTAFGLPHPAANKSVFGSTSLATGDYVVIDLSKVVDGNITKPDEAKIKTLTRNLAGQQGQADFDDLLAGLKKKAKIEIEQDKL